MLFLVDAKAGQHAVDALFDLGIRQVGTYLGAEIQGLSHPQLRVHDVVLRHIAHLLSEAIVEAIQVGAVEQHEAALRPRVAVQRF